MLTHLITTCINHLPNVKLVATLKIISIILMLMVMMLIMMIMMMSMKSWNAVHTTSMVILMLHPKMMKPLTTDYTNSLPTIKLLIFCAMLTMTLTQLRIMLTNPKLCPHNTHSIQTISFLFKNYFRKKHQLVQTIHQSCG